MTKILIADDHPIIRNGIIYIVKTKFVFASVLEADDGNKALELILKEKPELAILDIDMPYLSGIEVCRRISKVGIKTKTVILTMHKDEDIFNEAMDIGADGYLLKDNAVSEIVSCINHVLAGNKFASPEVEKYLIARTNKIANLSSINDLMHTLTTTEFKILQLIAKAKTSNQIASLHFISIRTVDSHRANICKKLNLKGNNALLMFVASHSKMLNPEN
ncbi:MAG: response regulator transcription factor [Saprospiraceae bacterium]|nr:response regulator transcription factor [Saprospiraceae bacterium]